jgi:cyanate permease
MVWMTAQIGAAFSPLLVVPIQMRYGWRAPFFVFGVVGVLWSLAWYSWFRDSPHEKAGVTASNAASALSSVIFGYLVGYFGNYNTPFVPMVALLCVGTLLWLQADPTRELLPEESLDESLVPLTAGIAPARLPT